MAYLTRPQTKTTAKDRKIDKNLEQLLTELFLHDVNFFNFLVLLSLNPNYQDQTIIQALLSQVFKYQVSTKELEQLQADLSQLDAQLYQQTLASYQDLIHSQLDPTIKAQSKPTTYASDDYDHGNLDDNSNDNLDDYQNNSDNSNHHSHQQHVSDNLVSSNQSNSSSDNLDASTFLTDERQDNQGEWVDTLEEFSDDSFDSDEFDDFGEEFGENEIEGADEFVEQELVQDYADQISADSKLSSGLTTNVVTASSNMHITSQTNPTTATQLKDTSTATGNGLSANSVTRAMHKLFMQFSSNERENLEQLIKEYVDSPLPNPHNLGQALTTVNGSLVTTPPTAYDLTQVYHYTQELSKLDYRLDYSQNFSSKLLTKALANALVAVNEEIFNCNSFVEQQDLMFEELFEILDSKNVGEQPLTGLETEFKVIDYLESSRLKYNFSLNIANRQSEDLANLQQLAQAVNSPSSIPSVSATTNHSITANSDIDAKVQNLDSNSSSSSSKNSNSSHANLTKFCFMSEQQLQTTPWYKLSDYFLLNGGLNKLHGFDISHWAGEDTIGSCVATNIDGVMPAEYRYFNITGITPGDDIAAIYQSVHKRYRSVTELTDLPLVVMIDGGQNQLNAANKALNPIIKTLQARQTYLTLLLGGQTLLSSLVQKNGLLFAQDSNYLALVAADYVYNHYLVSAQPSLDHDQHQDQNLDQNLDQDQNQNQDQSIEQTKATIDLALPYRRVSVDTALKVLFTHKSLQIGLTNLINQEQYHSSSTGTTATTDNIATTNLNQVSTQHHTKLDPLASLSQALGSDRLSQKAKAKEIIHTQEQQNDYVLNRLLAYCQKLPTWSSLTFTQQKQLLDYLLVKQASTHLSLVQAEDGIISDVNDINLLQASHPLTQLSLLKRLPYDLTLSEFKKLVFSSNCFYVLIHPVKTIGVTKQDHRKLYAEKFLAGDTGDIIEIPMHSNEQYLILKLRDAAHNYANRKRESHYQRTKTYSFSENLLAIPSIGKASADKLMTHFKTPAGLLDFLQKNPDPKSYLIKTVGLSTIAANSLIANTKLLLR